ncbi:PUA-like domain-containing protein [Dunaliella salina]|uniref:PUA-like domain-containing protein n=1 Tax=Dunaliella salina TaxID=3046 RepID=A0ABQ7FYQ6_DUNSA|nr:PUA-like domain-containing protein [Dunaliella salina]|eukprot:KAF5827502.1 PUA-like domain-containing protein [Dunaliella salina]
MSDDESLVVKAVDLGQWILDNSENARGSLHAILQEYREVEGGLRSKGEKKPDMQAVSQLKHLTPTVMFGHVPGMLPGDVFKNRGELAVLGGHTQYSRGIDNRVADLQGARAIVLSGGYKDDADHGSTMWYTGQGGQKNKQQVEDQEWVRDNLGLKQNAQTGTPVRVFRGSRDSAGETRYTYEGLYAVKEARRVKSKDGPLICQFLLDGLPNGHSVASTKVEFKSMSKKTYQPRTRLAAPDENSAPVAPRPSKKSKVPVIGSAEAPWGPIDRKAREARRAAAAKKPGLVSDDLSNGLEPHVPIPCYNELDDGALPPRLNYTPDYKWHPGVKEQLSGVLKALDEQMLHYRGGHTCSMAFNQAMMLKVCVQHVKYQCSITSK